MKRWATPAFTIVEILVVILVLSILVTISIIGYNAVHKATLIRVAQSNLDNIDSVMQHTYQETGSYPATIPQGFTPSEHMSVSVDRSGETPYYTNLSTVQNGVLLSQICDDLIQEGAGKGVDQGGTTRDYITGCGNWNNNGMQITAWDTKQWSTPVTKNQLLNYATSYNVSNTYHKAAQEATVKNFYQQLVSRQEAEGGGFPITSFWDFWATPTNGGVQLQPLSTHPQTKPYYCVEVTADADSSIIWHVTEESKIRIGGC